jgi:hypothetical protein
MEKVGGSAGEKKLVCRNILDMALFNFQMRLLFCLLVLALVAAGCVTKSHADAQARAAYLAGQQAAYQSMGQTMTDVVVLGNVDKHEVPWVQGLTLTQALGTANYKGAQDPVMIILKRNSVETDIDPKQLLNGQDVTLQPGDVVSVVGQ